MEQDDASSSSFADEPPDETPDNKNPEVENSGIFEEILRDIYGSGRYQLFTVLFVLLPSFFALSSIQSLVYFVIPIPDDYWCRIPQLDANASLENEFSLLPQETEKPFHSQCEMYNLDYEALLSNLSMNDAVEYVAAFRQNLTRVPCQFGWKYDQSVYENTIATEWDLVCGQTFLPTLAYILTSIGGAIGIAAGGFLADITGRKRTYFIALFVVITFGTVTAFSPNYMAYVVLTILLATGTNSLYQVPYTIGVEILSPKTRSRFSMGLTIFYACGGLIVALLAYFIRSWRLFMIVGTVPYALFFIYWFFMPESPRWLMLHGRTNEAIKQLLHIAKVNGINPTLEWETKLKNLCIKQKLAMEKNRKRSCLRRAGADVLSWAKLFQSPGIRRQTFLLTYLSCNVAICYNGLNFYAPSLGSDPYLSFFLSSVIELPGSLMTGVIAERVGRRLTTIICLIGGCTACFGISAVPDGSYWSLLAAFLVAKLFLTASYVTQELMTYEAFPTEIRAIGVAFVTTVSYVATNFGPLIVYLRFENPVLPFAVFGIISFLGIICVLWLPETHNRSLPETVEECDHRGREATIKTLCDFRLRNAPSTQKLELEVFVIEETKL